jgi:spermidine synthase
MGRFSKWRVHRAFAGGASVEVSERDGIRTLHLGSDTVQSAMRLSAPYDLELAYTRSMMGFLLFRPDPARVAMIGLGGGSLAKFVYHRLPGVRMVAVEINPEVLAAARSHFFLPPEDERFSVVIGEGGQYVAEHPESCDVLMVDGFDGFSQAETLSTQTFYHDCARALTGRGVLVVNLWSSDRNFSTYLGRIEAAFEGLTLCLPTDKHGNVIVFALKRTAGNPRWDTLGDRARELQARAGLEFPEFVRRLREANAHTENRLLI